MQALTTQFVHYDPDPTGRGAANFFAALDAVNPEILLTGWATPGLPKILPGRLRYVCHLCGSVRHLVSRAQIERGLLVTNWGDSISRTVAEGALLHILASLRRATRWTLAMHREKGWLDGPDPTQSLFGQKVGLHGFGRVARELVALLRPFGVTVACFAPDVTPGNAASHGVQCAPSLEALFAKSDIVVELAPLCASTVNIVLEKHLRLIRPGGVFVNVGRAAVVDETALLRVAREGRIFLGLDVFTVEPLPADSPLRGLDNVFLTPHLAGPTPDRRRDAGALAVANVSAYAEDRPLRAVVTAEAYDSST